MATAAAHQKAKLIPAPGKSKQTILVGGYDSVILFTVLTLVVFGIVMIFSSSYYAAATNQNYENNMFYFLSKQVTAVGVGFAGMLVLANFNYKYLKGPLIYIPYFLSNALLVYVRLFCEKVNGAYRWIKIPFFGSFQPSEFAKIMVIIVLASYISADKTRVRRLSGLLYCGAIIALPCLLVFWGSNLSTMLIIGAIGFCMIFVASPRFVPFIAAAGGAAAALIAYLSLGDSYQSGRFAIWKNPFMDPMGDGYQTIQSLYAVASGGLFGLGLGQSHQKLIYMPEPYNDFIFAVICEELGFVGASILLLLFVVLIWRGILVALKAHDLYGTLLALGITVLIAVQVIINVAVVTNTIPNTGIPLPFISYGGTSVAFIMAAMGILLNVSRYHKKG